MALDKKGWCEKHKRWASTRERSTSIYDNESLGFHNPANDEHYCPECEEEEIAYKTRNRNLRTNKREWYCKACHEQISGVGVHCPHCGYDIQDGKYLK